METIFIKGILSLCVISDEELQTLPQLGKCLVEDPNVKEARFDGETTVFIYHNKFVIAERYLGMVGTLNSWRLYEVE
jgi:hypothetical protein